MKSGTDSSLLAAAFISDTPAGSLTLAVSQKGLARLFFCTREDYIHFLADNDMPEGNMLDGMLGEVIQQVKAYFSGHRKAFDLPLDLAGQTTFRTRVLLECAQIPFGQTITYGELAARSGSPRGARAAGGAMANNPIALVIPCHRVVGSDRGLHGFSSPGGLGTKAILLAHEGVLVEKERVISPMMNHQESNLGEENFRSGYAAVVGRPNVGKSTLINALLGQKIAAVSSKPQTTRQKQLGILTLPDTQIVFIDTPGIHLPRHKLGRGMNVLAETSLNEADAVIWLVDVSEEPQKEDELITEKLAALAEIPPVLQVLNKMDLLSDAELEDRRIAYAGLYPRVDQQALSAKIGMGIENLVAWLKEKLPIGAPYYPKEQVTDYYEREIAADLIREAALERLREEVPHAIAVRMDEYKERDETGAFISATIFVEKDSQKGIVIGKGGLMLKSIGMDARKAIEAMSERKVFLELRVKVNKNWRSNPDFLRQMGYEDLGED